MRRAVTAIDLFAGAGGMTEGFVRAGTGFVAHVEKDKYCCETLKTRLYYHFLRENGMEDLYYRYLRNEITKEELRQEFLPEAMKMDEKVINLEIDSTTTGQIFDRIEHLMRQEGIKKIDLVVGGPPCQAYSLVGRARDPRRMRDDPRNYLYLHYIEFLKRFRPEVFVFENVPGILSAAEGRLFQDIRERLDAAGYEMDYAVLNSADFFVLQNRRRIMIIGWRKGLNCKYPVFERTEHNYRVADLLKDLPVLKAGEGSDRDPLEYAGPPGEYLVKTGIRTEKDTAVVNHRARALNPVDRERYRMAIEKYLEGKKIKYTDFPEHLQTHRNKNSFLDRFKVVDWNAPCSHTIVAHLSKDGHYFIHPDINQVRAITVREAARIQSFPDNYLFEGPRTSQYIQVGNAVPPLMAYRIALKIMDMLTG